MEQYCVLHIDKSTGGEARMTAHIERSPEDIVCHKTNIDESRTHLNRSLIDYPPEVSNRTQAIEHRISTAGIKRKVSDNQVRVLRIMLSGTHERMKELEAEGRIDDWCKANIDWAKATFGADNVVSAELHMDEKTPHIHLSVVPIVKEATKRKGKDGSIKVGKEKVRLAARDVLTAAKLAKYQTTYAAAMAKFGLQRGVEGSEAQHLSKEDWMRNERRQHEEVKQKMDAEVKDKRKAADEEIKRIDEEVSEKKRKATTENIKGIGAGVANLFGKGKYAAIEAENNALKAAQATFDQKLKDEQVKTGKERQKAQNLSVENNKLKNTLKLKTMVTNLVRTIAEALAESFKSYGRPNLKSHDEMMNLYKNYWNWSDAEGKKMDYEEKYHDFCVRDLAIRIKTACIAAFKDANYENLHAAQDWVEKDTKNYLDNYHGQTQEQEQKQDINEEEHRGRHR